MKKCRSVKNYKGIHKPRCNGGKGCDECWEIYQRNCGHEIKFLQHKSLRCGKPNLSYTSHQIVCSRCKKIIHHSSLGQFPLYERLIELSDINEQLKTDVSDLRLDVEEMQQQVQRLEWRVE